MHRLYTCQQVKALDRAAIETQGIPSFDLMQSAAKAALTSLRKTWPGCQEISVYCGGGNNGGDGYVLASMARKLGFKVHVLGLKPQTALSGDAVKAFQLAAESGVTIHIAKSASELAQFTPAGIIVDALLGIGLSGHVRGLFASAIEQINQSGLPVLSIDIPSGLCGDTGKILGSCARADTTVTFIARKQGLFTADAGDCVGNLLCEDLGVSSATLETQTSELALLELQPPLLCARQANSHKGGFGRLLVIGGGRGMGGAPIMSAEAGLLTGAGIVNLITHADNLAAAWTRRPELMATSIDQTSQYHELLTDQSATVFGPGMGPHFPNTQTMLNRLIELGKPMVVDADALRLIAESQQRYDYWVLTPHPGEAAALLNCTSQEIQANRFGAAKAIQQKMGGIVVLKGAGTIIADRRMTYICDRGNPAMASPGMGDVLAGIIGGLLAQGLAPIRAAQIGVWAHAVAGDCAHAELGKPILATELFHYLRRQW